MRVGYSKDYTVPSMSWELGDQLAWFAQDPESSWNMGSSGLKVGKSRDQLDTLIQCQITSWSWQYGDMVPALQTTLS